MQKRKRSVSDVKTAPSGRGGAVLGLRLLASHQKLCREKRRSVKLSLSEEKEKHAPS